LAHLNQELETLSI